MTARNHVLTSVNIAFVPFIYNQDLMLSDSFLLFIAGVIFGALIPDIDEERSSMGSKIKPLSFALHISIGHRTISHNLFLWAVVALYGFKISSAGVFGIGVGAILHILEDGATNNGVKWALKPLYGNFSTIPKKMTFATNGSFETFVYSPIIIIITIAEMVIATKVLFPDVWHFLSAFIHIQ